MVSSFRTPDKLIKKLREKYLDKNKISMNDFIVRSMLLAVENPNFLKMIDEEYWNVARKLEKEYPYKEEI